MGGFLVFLSEQDKILQDTMICTLLSKRMHVWTKGEGSLWPCVDPWFTVRKQKHIDTWGDNKKKVLKNVGRVKKWDCHEVRGTAP